MSTVAEPEATVEVQDLALGADKLRTALVRISHAQGDSRSRPVLQAVLFEGDAEGLRVCAADNYRIAVAEVAEGDYSHIGRAIVADYDVDLLRVFLKRKGSVEIERDDDTLRIRDRRGATLTFRLYEGTYPNYRQIIPSPEGRHTVSLNPRYIADAGKGLKGGLTAKVYIGTPLEPVLFTAPGYTEVVMPVRVPDKQS